MFEGNCVGGVRVLYVWIDNGRYFIFFVLRLKMKNVLCRLFLRDECSEVFIVRNVFSYIVEFGDYIDCLDC